MHGYLLDSWQISWHHKTLGTWGRGRSRLPGLTCAISSGECGALAGALLTPCPPLCATTTSAEGNSTMGGETGEELFRLWLPYMILTAVILLLLIASFIHFHCKYKERYAKRHQLAREGEAEVPGGGGRASMEVPNMINMPRNWKHFPSQKRPRRLNMYYGNKVDVSSIVKNHMFEGQNGAPGSRRSINGIASGRIEKPSKKKKKNRPAVGGISMEGRRSDSKGSFRSDDSVDFADDDDHYYKADGSVRTVTKPSNGPRPTIVEVGDTPYKRRYSVSIWSNAAVGKAVKI